MNIFEWFTRLMRRRDVEILKAANEELQEKIATLKLEIKEFESTASHETDSILDEISNKEKEIEKRQNDIQIKTDEISQRNALYTRLVSPNNKNNELRQLLSTTESRLKSQRKQIGDIIANLVQINNRQLALNGYEWMKQKSSVQTEISNLKREIEATAREREFIEEKIKQMKSERDSIVPIYEKWKGRVLPEAKHTFGHLMRELKQRQTPSEHAKKRLEAEIETNESIRQEIEKLRRESANKVRKVRKAITEMRKQTNEVYEQAALEEQIMIQRIIAMKDSI